MTTIEQYSGKQLPYLMMGSAVEAGDLVYMSTGSGLRYASGAGTANQATFVGVAAEDCVAGSYCAVICDSVVQLTKYATDKIEAGNIIYGSKSANTVGTIAKGTGIGVCVKQSPSTDTRVSVLLRPFWVQGAGGYHA